MRRPPQAIQILGSVLVALAIAAVAIAVVTTHFGPTSAARLDAREDLVEERARAREDAAELREERREEALDRREDGGRGQG